MPVPTPMPSPVPQPLPVPAEPGADVPPRRAALRWSRRLIQLYVGLALYGVSGGLQVQANLGLDPWDVLHQGVASRVHLSIGVVSIIVGALVLLAWIPIRQRPGLGTVSNVFMVGFAMNVTIAVVPAPDAFAARFALLLGGILLCGLATGMYISVGLGPGPRDGLMTGWSARLGLSIRLTRTVLELTVLASGWALGGTVGVGTVLFAVLIGPLAQLFLRAFGVRRVEPAAASVLPLQGPEAQ
ncbi:hypothetical protein M6D93_07420 [Jatrophihabitans telluris]|uniref:YitT family protein n=1 Tax=Jatrophihabitans telluris TaxID=2038343 RepID=A0ABY4R1U6_9ACTN|nr:hypothetical protein [Jatrophihabitans telluris]UQX89824.1 hypothetical protein M6D93_07420 [Jatrophihabitans telluris]